MVAVNPHHPVIRQQFDDALKKAVKDAKGRRHFALEVSIFENITHGYKPLQCFECKLQLKAARSYSSKFSFVFHLKNHHSKDAN